MSYTPSPARSLEDELGDATDMVTAAPTDRQLTELGGVTPTDGGIPVEDFCGATLRMTERRDELDEPTNLMPNGELALAMARSLPTPPRNLAKMPEGTRPPPLLARGSDPTITGRRAARDTIPNERLEDTKPHPAIQPLGKKMLGGYKITGVLASGGMGVVYSGEHPSMRRPVAIKAVHGQLQTNPAIVARFFAESIALARVVHPNVVRFFDFGYDAEGSAYLVMELLEGETLTTRLARERRLDISLAIDIAIQISQALAAAHKKGVVHRDIKPDNVFLCGEWPNVTVKLLDFGVAKIEGQGPMQTMQGDLLGTAAYMAPEQGRSASESDGRSDLYSVGCILFEMVCGVVPFPGSLVETLVAHQTAERPPARALNPDVPAKLDQTIDRLLARDPQSRPQTAGEVVQALASIESTVQRPLMRGRRAGTEIIARRLADSVSELASKLAASRRATAIALALLVLVVVLTMR